MVPREGLGPRSDSGAWTLRTDKGSALRVSRLDHISRARSSPFISLYRKTGLSAGLSMVPREGLGPRSDSGAGALRTGRSMSRVLSRSFKSLQVFISKDRPFSRSFDGAQGGT